MSFIKSVFSVFSSEEEEDVDDRRLKVVSVDDSRVGLRAGHGEDVDV